MKAWEKLLQLSGINGCATAAAHFCSALKGAENVFNYCNEVIGIAYKGDVVIGNVDCEMNVKGVVDASIEIIGLVNIEDQVNGVVSDNQITGKNEC